MTKETIQKVITDKPNSYEFGKAGNRFKLYFNTAEDLQKEIQALVKIGLILEDNNPLNSQLSCTTELKGGQN